jgi:hypothetical protein
MDGRAGRLETQAERNTAAERLQSGVALGHAVKHAKKANPGTFYGVKNESGETGGVLSPLGLVPTT